MEDMTIAPSAGGGAVGSGSEPLSWAPVAKHNFVSHTTQHQLKVVRRQAFLRSHAATMAEPLVTRRCHTTAANVARDTVQTIAANVARDTVQTPGQTVMPNAPTLVSSGENAN
jgi:hypothetical protein